MRKKRRKLSEVELNLAAMLDMAFQLLTFFILTFRPAPVEGDIVLRLPPAMPTTMLKNAQKMGSDENNTNPVQGLNSLIVNLVSNDSGTLAGITLGDNAAGNLDEFAKRLAAVLQDEAAGFEQVVLQVDSRLSYDELMQVVDVCTRQTLPGGKKLTKLSFAEIPPSG